MGENVYLTQDQIDKLLNDVNTLSPRKLSHDRIKLLIKVLLTGALRISEALNLTPNDILGNGKLVIRESKGGFKRCDCSRWSFHPTTLVFSDKSCSRCKGLGKYRVNQFAYVSDEVLAELLRVSEPMGKDERFFPISRTLAWYYFDRLANARTHSFRHTWLTKLLETEKFNIRDMKQKARHSSISTTGKYIEDNDDYTRQKERNAMNELMNEKKELDIL